MKNIKSQSTRLSLRVLVALALITCPPAIYAAQGKAALGDQSRWTLQFETRLENAGSERPIGIRLSQGNVLAVTAKLGVARPAEVCDILELDTSTLSRTVDRMVENGWLEIVPDEDGRSQPFRLTDQGRRLMEKSVPAWEKAQAEATKLLGEDGLRLLDAAIKRVKSARATS